MSYGLHRVDKPWRQQEDETDHGDTNELIDGPPNEDGRLVQRRGNAWVVSGRAGDPCGST